VSLSTGTKLGPYEILSPLGAGGMGEVYRARDTRLARDVAIKILPTAFASDAERLRRFEQEARAAGALNHPNVLTLYDIGMHDGTPFLVTEMLEGETLGARLQAGPLPMRKALETAIQAARGVAAAHEKGIIHRDLKPANIFLTADGRVKVLDFGLAKLTQSDSAGFDETQSPTVTAGLGGQTGAGVVLGTVGYMSPEQVRGKPADARSDIFALGTILYEMLSGQRPFARDSVADTMAAILKEDPPELAGEGRKISPAVERVVRRCLEKNPAQRFQSAQDLAFSLESLSATSTPSTAAISGTKSPARKWLGPVVIALIVLCLGAAGAWFLIQNGASRPQPVYHPLTFERGLIYAARFAADGHSVFYSASWSGQPIQLYSTNPNGPESRPLNLSNSTLYAVSPSEMAISMGCKDVFIGDCEGTLAVAPVSGGAPREITDHVLSADWTPQGNEMAVVREAGGKFRVEFPLGKVLYESGSWISFVRISPRGNAVAFVEYATAASDAGWVVILDRDGRSIARSPEQFPSVEGLAWPPAGNDVWCAASIGQGYADAIHALSFAGKDRIVLRLPGAVRLYDISRDGRVLISKDVWRSGVQWHGSGNAGERDLSWLDASTLMDLSSDGQNLEFSEFGETTGSSSLAYLRKTDGSPAVKLGFGYAAALSPDGKWVLAADFPPRLVVLPTGAGEAKHLEPQGLEQFASPGWMPDGKQIYFAGYDGHDWRMYTQDPANGAPHAFTPPLSVNQQIFDSHLLSPDGKFVVARDLNGSGRLYPIGGGQPQPVAGLTADDIWINWSGDGRTAYVYQDEKTHAQLFRLDLSTGKRQLVTTVGPADPAGLTSTGPMRITPDGKSYAYSYNRSLSDLYLAEGVK
jgi:serine/threonine protein kinase